MNCSDLYGERRLANWELWERRRREAAERLCPQLGRTPSALLMHREGAWHQRRKDQIATRHWQETGLSESSVPGIAWKCLQGSVEKFQRPKKPEDSRVVEAAPPGVPELLLVGKATPSPPDKSSKFKIPEIRVYPPEAPSMKDESSEESILEVGPRVVKEGESFPLTCRIEMCPAREGVTQARDLVIANAGQKAISYSWKKKKPPKTFLPLSYTKNALPRFFFNKSEGILLPGQSLEHRFLFFSRTPGFFRETWILLTTPKLPRIIFILEAVASRSKESDSLKSYVELERRLERSVQNSAAQELAESFLEGVEARRTEDLGRRFLEGEIFLATNPLLQYDMDCLREIKELHARYSSESWNYSMTDLCELLLERTKSDSPEERTHVMRKYCKLLHKLQKTPLSQLPSSEDWERFRLDLCRLILCSSVARMEAVDRHYNWGMFPPSRPPGPRDEYSGIMFDKEDDLSKMDNIATVRFSHVKSMKEARASLVGLGEHTDDEEERLALEEDHLTGDDVLEERVVQVGQKIELDGKDDLVHPRRRQSIRSRKDEPQLQNHGDKKEAQQSKPGRKASRRLRETMQGEALRMSKVAVSMYSNVERQTRHASPELKRFRKAFLRLHWHQLLAGAVEAIADLAGHLKREDGEGVTFPNTTQLPARRFLHSTTAPSSPEHTAENSQPQISQ